MKVKKTKKPQNKLLGTVTALPAAHRYIASTAGNSSATVFSFTFALVTRITDSTTITLPIKINRSTRSCRINHPRKTATTGLTYAYVATFDVGTCAISQLYAVFPIHDPHTPK